MNGVESENNLRLFINEPNVNEKVQGLCDDLQMLTDKSVLQLPTIYNPLSDFLSQHQTG